MLEFCFLYLGVYVWIPRKYSYLSYLLDPLIHLDVLVEGGDTMHPQRGDSVHVLGNVHSLAGQDQAIGDIIYFMNAVQ